jgi:hypothetical protein
MQTFYYPINNFVSEVVIVSYSYCMSCVSVSQIHNEILYVYVCFFLIHLILYLVMRFESFLQTHSTWHKYFQLCHTWRYASSDGWTSRSQVFNRPQVCWCFVLSERKLKLDFLYCLKNVFEIFITSMLWSSMIGACYVWPTVHDTYKTLLL